MKRFAITIVAVLGFFSSIFGREIKGRVVDVEGAPMEFVNAVLLMDSTFVTGTITNSNGEFSLSSELTVGLTLKLSCIGFDTKIVDITPNGLLGDIKMINSNTQLKEVIVKGAASKTYLRGNSLVTNVENSILANAGTAKDVLKQIPMVTEHNGNIEVFGKGAPTVYVNGRKVSDLQELSTLLSSSIRYVEVITNPGASYSADAKAVIRIRTKKSQGDGWSGTLRTTHGFQYRYQNANIIDMKYRMGGFEVFSNFAYNVGDNQEKKITDMTTLSKFK